MSSKTGKEDQKSLYNLTKMLEEKKIEAVSSRNQRATSRINKSLSPQSKPIRKKRDKKIVKSTQSNKISRWLKSPILIEDSPPRSPTKKKRQRNKSSSTSRNENAHSSKEKESPCANAELPNKVKSSKEETNKDYSYDEKYGVLLPSLEKILKDRKNFAEHKQQARELKELLDGDDFKVDFKVQEQDQSRWGQLKDCKHLSQDEIAQGFDRHCDFLKNVMSGDEFSLRHEKFKFDFKLQQTLTGSSSMLVFNDEQISQMVSLMRKKFDPDNLKTRYFFQVLVPELTLLIFMDDQKMTKKEAIEYLDNMPL